MGYQLRRWLREELGQEIAGLQRAVALEIADDANDATRMSFATLEDLRRWTAAKDVNVVRNALKRLSAQGWEFRVPIGRGKDGRLLYAVPGVRMTFRVQEVAGATPKGEPGLPIGVAGAPSEGAGATPFSSDPSTIPSLSSTPPVETRNEREKSPSDLTTRLATIHGATSDEVTAVLAAATRNGIRSIPAWMASEVGVADFTARLDELRRASRPAPARPTCGQCDGGWIGEDDEGRPIRCTTCKPHLVLTPPSHAI